MRLCWFLAAAGVLSLSLGGCGPALYKPHGRVVKGGAPYQTPQGEFLRVTFLPASEGQKGKDPFAANFNNADGTFQVVGKDLRGLPPGKYRVLIEHIDKKKHDVLSNAYDRADPAMLTFEVGGNTPEIVIDLDKWPS